jgi:hypothetical protein
MSNLIHISSLQQLTAMDMNIKLPNLELFCGKSEIPYEVPFIIAFVIQNQMTLVRLLNCFKRSMVMYPTNILALCGTHGDSLEAKVRSSLQQLLTISITKP